LIAPLSASENSKSKSKAKIKTKQKRKYRKKRRRKKSKAVRYIDGTQRFISTSWLGLTYNMDSYFADTIYDRAKNRSQIMAYYDFFKREGEKIEHYFDVRIKLHLPEMSRKLSVTVEKERDEILEARSSQATKSQATKDSEYTASVSYQLNDSKAYKTEFNTGLRFILPLDPYVKLRFYKSIQMKPFDIFLEQKFIYFKQDDFQEATIISFYKKLNERFSFSQGNALSWRDADDRFVLRNSASLNHLLSTKRSLSYSIGANALLSPTIFYNLYDASIGYRQVLYKDWLLGYSSFGAEFPKSKNWEMTNFVVLRLEVLF
jgi:hypothetical protein